MIRRVTEERRGDVPLFVHPEWQRTFPWLVQGTTGREAGNFASFGEQSAEALHAQWRNLRRATAMRTSILGRQVHGAHVLEHGPQSPGLLLADDSDGHTTAAAGVLLAVSVADCVPVFVVAAERRRVAVLHAGWRGTAAGIVRNCIEIMGSEVHVHFGPGICGECYEVGAEVHAALELPRPDRNTPVDLRAVLAGQCRELGIPERNMTTSSFCTRCGDPPFYSHRAGQPERQAGVIGVR
ncbi:MAG: polyphenol oxidase family protein [Gemmatimonadota bacterium]